MAVLIKGMEMPDDCVFCPFRNYAPKIGGYCDLDHEETNSNHRPSHCTLIEVKEPKQGDRKLLEAAGFEI